MWIFVFYIFNQHWGKAEASLRVPEQVVMVPERSKERKEETALQGHAMFLVSIWGYRGTGAGLDTDLVNHANVQLLNVRDEDIHFRWFREGEAQVMDHDGDQAWEQRLHL